MHLLAPDILAEGHGLSWPLSAAGLLIGVLLWLFGWRAHRFWIVLLATVAAGISGLYSGPRHGLPPLVASLLLAVAFGVLALALARVVAFAAGGIAAWMLAHFLIPQWDEPLLWLLAGGLLGLWLFRVWTMVVTSSAGTLVMGYSLLWLLEPAVLLNSAEWSEKHSRALDWTCAGVAAGGVLLQFLLDRRRSQRRKQKDEEEKQAREEAESRAKAKKKGGWFPWSQPSKKKAG
jgi:hypothetical protein